MGYMKNSLKKVRSKILADIPSRIFQQEQTLKYLKEQEKNRKLINSTILQVHEREVVTKLHNGLKIYLDPTDIAVAPHIALDGVWEKSITDAWNRALENKKIVFDIGANFGYYGLLSANRLNGIKDSRVVLFEANPNLIPYIHKTVSVNWLNTNTKVENVGIADKKGTAELTILKDYIGCSSLQTTKELSSYLDYKMDIETDEKVTVDTISVDEYCEQNKIKEVGLIKLDIEGFEQKAYQGMKNTIKNSKDLTLFIEFTKDAYKEPEAFYNQLASDFEHAYIIGDNSELHLLKKDGFNKFIRQGPDWVMLVFSKNNMA